MFLLCTCYSTVHPSNAVQLSCVEEEASQVSVASDKSRLSQSKLAQFDDQQVERDRSRHTSGSPLLSEQGNLF